MSCSKLIYCDECTSKNCWWAAKLDETTTCVPSDEDIGNGFSYFVSPGDTEGCAPFKATPIETETPSWAIGIIVFGIILVIMCGLGILYKRKCFSAGILSWIDFRRNATDLEMVQLNEGDVKLSTAV